MMGMDRARFQRLKELFSEARERPADARRPWLEAACGDDRELLDEALALLASDEADDDDALAASLAGDGHRDAPAPGMPEQLGRYTLVRVVGHGGMGTVWEARQDAPKRRVALKVVQVGALRPDVLERFRREAEILGRLQHPAIAQVFEAGDSELQGVRVPWFAMEFVEGPDLLTFADERALSTAARVELFARVCDAVQHAHERGVVHRDLKPDNVLVVEGSATTLADSSAELDRAQPKVLDFGVAKVADADVRASLSTGAGQLLGSVPWMSPEQASADRAVDARSDVYSLGVLLFRLLTGAMPYEVEHRPLTAALRTIQEQAPARLGAADARLRGDLETVVAKCLEKDPSDRYGSAARLASDLRRWLAHRPVLAQPPSTWYQLRKFARRNRVLVGGVLATGAALLVGLVVALQLMVGSQRNEERAERNAQTAERNADAARRAERRAHLLAADALLGSEPAQARRMLDAVDEADRGWEWLHLDACLAEHVLEIEGVFRETPLVVLDDGATLLVARDARTVGAVDLGSGAVLARWRTMVPAVAWGLAPDGSRLAFATAEGAVWAATIDARGASTAGASGAASRGVDDVVPSRGEASAEPIVPRWELLHDGEPGVRALVPSPDGARVAVVRDDGLVVVDDAGARAVTLPRGIDTPAACWSPDGARLVALTLQAGAPRLWVFDPDALGGAPEVVGEGGLLLRVTTQSSPRAIAFTPDGRTLVAGTIFRDVRLFDADDLSDRGRFLGHTKGVNAVAPGPDGTVLSASRDGSVRIWSAEGEELAVLSEPGVRAVVAAGRDRVVTATDDRVHVWDLAGEARRVLTGHASYVYQLAFARDGALLASQAPVGTPELFVWDVLESLALASLPTHHGRKHLVFGDDGRVTSSLGFSNYDHVWPARTRTARWSEDVHALSWRRTGDDLFVGGVSVPFDDGAAEHLVRVEHGPADGARTPSLWIDGERRADLSGASTPPPARHPRLSLGGLAAEAQDASGAVAEVVVLAGWLGPDEARAVEAALDAGVDALGDVLPARDDVRVLARFRAAREHLELAPAPAGTPPAGRGESAGDGDDDVSDRDARDDQDATDDAVALGDGDAAGEGDATPSGEDPTNTDGDVTSAGEEAASPAPVVLAWRSVDGAVVLRAVGSAERALRFTESPAPRVVFDNHHAAQRWLEGALPAARDVERFTVLWRGRFLGAWGSSYLQTAYALGDAPTPGGREPPRRADLPTLGTAAARSADGRVVASTEVSGPFPVVVRDGDTGEVLGQWAGRYWSTAVSPDGRSVACGDHSGRLDVIEVATGDVRSVDAHDGTVYAVAWTPDGARLATGGNDNTVRLWDPEHLEPLLELRGHEQYVKAIAFSPDGTMLASGSGDGTVRLWDAAPRVLRHAQIRERRARRDEVRPRVDAWFAEGLSAEEVVARVVDAWSAEDPRRWAGFEVVAAR